MKDSNEHLGALALGYMWNHPLQQLNDLLEMKHSEKMSAELKSALGKLTDGEKAAFKQALIGIFSQDISDLFLALDESTKHGVPLEIKDSEDAFSHRLPPWQHRLSYFDQEGNPKPQFAHR